MEREMVVLQKAFQLCFIIIYCASKSCQLAINRPTLDPGVFAIQGVSTCLQGQGYCLLGKSCSVDDDFEGTLDEEGQHCDGLRSAFHPPVQFICCKPVTKSIPETETGEESNAVQLEDVTTESIITTAVPTEAAQQNVIEIDLGGGEEEAVDKTIKHNNLVSQVGNAAANTNNILENLAKLKLDELPDAEFLLGSAEDSHNTDFEFIENDKSLIGLILAGLNESLKLDPDSKQ